MILETWFSVVYRIAFIGAFALIILAVVEKLANLFLYTILRGAFTPSRLLELAVILLVVVIAILLREVRKELMHSHP